MDSLPYVDVEIDDPATLKIVQAEIDREIKSGKISKDYSHIIDKICGDGEENKFLSPILQEQLSFYAKQEKDDHSKRVMISTKRYEIPSPEKSESENLQSWQNCIDNARAQLQHQYNRAVNIELASNNSAAMWRINNRILSAMNNQLNGLTEKLVEETKLINWERKQSQEKCFNETEIIKNEYYELVRKNIELQAVCASFENPKQAD